MTLADIEWPLLRNALIALALSTAAAGAAVGMTEGRLQQLRLQNQQQQQSVTQARDLYYGAVQERQLVDDYWPEYRKLEAMGFIGEENRLNWVDVLRDIARKHRVLALHYEVQPRAPQTVDGITDTGEFQLQSSEMSLRMNVLHEGNVLDLLKDLNDRKVGLFSIRSCVFERVTDDIVLHEAQPNVSANCTLVWHSIQPGVPPT